MFACSIHTVELYDRGGRRKMGTLGPLARVRYERVRDDISAATAYVEAASIECNEVMGRIEAGRHEMVVFKNGARVWEGPITRVAYQGSSIEVEAQDVVHYLKRTIIRREYNNAHPNVTTVLARLQRIFSVELSRKEALNPPANILPHVKYITSPVPGEDARTSSRTLPYELSVFEHLDAYAARGGIDYTVVGRSLLLFDVHQKIGETPTVTADDFIGQPVITQYGMELATEVAMTDGRGNYGKAGGNDPYYGEWEVLHQAYDEDTAQEDDPVPSVAEMQSQAERTLSQGKVPPMVVRVPENTTINPNGSLSLENLVPGVWIPLSVSVPSRTITQMQKLDSMSVEESEKGLSIKVSMSPVPITDNIQND